MRSRSGPSTRVLGYQKLTAGRRFFSGSIVAMGNAKRGLFAVSLRPPGVVRHFAASQPMIELSTGGITQSFSRAALLTRPGADEIQVPRNVAYSMSTTYRVALLADLLNGTQLPAHSVLNARATDGFAVQLPITL